MFGFTKRTKTQLLDDIEALEEQLRQERIKREGLEARIKQIVPDITFWQNQCVEYGNQIGFWQKKNHELLEKITDDSANVDLREYVAEVRAEIQRARPEPAAIAAALAMGGRGVQGQYTPAPREEIAERGRLQSASKAGVLRNFIGEVK